MPANNFFKGKYSRRECIPDHKNKEKFARMDNWLDRWNLSHWNLLEKTFFSKLESFRMEPFRSVEAERPTNVALLASMSLCNLSLKNWYEAFAMARCNKRSRPEHV
jgi:hypothetical protein